MNKRKYLLFCIILVTITIGVIAIYNVTKDNHSRKFEKDIIAVMEADEGEVVDLRNVVDFDFDEAVVFEYPTYSKDIYNLTGVRYDKSLDLANGILFFKSKKIIYEWFFENVYEHVSNFVVYPYYDEDNKKKNMLLSGDDCIFRGEIIKSGDQKYYRLYPIINAEK